MNKAPFEFSEVENKGEKQVAVEGRVNKENNSKGEVILWQTETM